MKTVDIFIKTAKSASLWCIDPKGIAVRYPGIPVPEEQKVRSGFYYYSTADVELLNATVVCLEGPVPQHKFPSEVRQLFEIELWAASLPAPPSESVRLFVNLKELKELKEQELLN